MDKLDLRKSHKAIYAAAAGPTLVEVPSLKALAIDGEGHPESADFAQAMGALYSLAYTLKFSMKKAKGLDWTVMPLEGDWWCDDMASFSMDRKGDWKWTLLIVQPDFVGPAEVEAAKAAAEKKEPNPALARVSLREFPAHRAVHVMHVGPYESEPPTIAGLHAYIKGEGQALAGRHREIYLGDPRRTAPEKLKTIIRQPVA